MTRDEAIVHIRDIICENNSIKPNIVVFEQEKEALYMAIEALEQEPNGDAINRIIKRMWNCRGKHTTSIDKVKMEQIIRDELQPVKPEKIILDKIRADIEKKIVKRPRLDFKDTERDRNDAFLEALDIIDKYRAESEEKE